MRDDSQISEHYEEAKDLGLGCWLDMLVVRTLKERKDPTLTPSCLALGTEGKEGTLTRTG